jgi:hypothetical protein
MPMIRAYISITTRRQKLLEKSWNLAQFGWDVIEIRMTRKRAKIGTLVSELLSEVIEISTTPLLRACLIGCLRRLSQLLDWLAFARIAHPLPEII